MAASFTYRLVACSVVALSSAWAATPASAAGRAITTDDVAFGGQELAQTVKVTAGGKFATVLRIRDIKFGPGEDVRATLQGVLSVRNLAKAGSTVVKLRMVVNGKPEPMLFSQTVAAGAYATVPILGNALVAAGQSYDYDLQVAVLGSGPLSVNAGTFDIFALRPIYIPP